MALTVSHIEADFVKDTKTIGKQSAYLEFHFGDRHHATDVLKSAGKFATWDTPVQLTGAGINMKIIAKASKSLAKDKPLGVGELNLVQAAGQGLQTVQLHDTITREYAGEVRLQISGGSPAISGLPHTEGHGLGGAGGGVLGHNSQGHEGHHHGAETAAGVGAAGLGAEALHHHHKQDQQQQQGVPQEGHHHGHKGEVAAGTGAAGLGAAALHHHHQNQNQGVNQGVAGQQYDQNTGLGGQQYGQQYNQTGTGVGNTGNTGTGYGTGTGTGVGQNTGAGFGGQQYNQTGTGVGGVGGQNTGAGTCPQCSGTGSITQRMEQGLHLGGQQPGGVHQQGTY